MKRKARVASELPDLFAWADPPVKRPDFMFGRCECGWLLFGWHISVLDQDGYSTVRHLFLCVPD